MKAEEWLKRAEKRIAAAETLFNGGLFEDCLFMAHQAVEVSFKAVIVHKTKKLAPRVHSLQQLAKITGLRIHLLLHTWNPLMPAFDTLTLLR